VLLGLSEAGTAWRTQWLALVPRTDTNTQRLLNLLIRTIDSHSDKLIESGAQSARALRQELSGQLISVFRAAAGTVIATACHLAMLGLDLERMRGGLISRALLTPAGGELA
jgi:hypothetical protein